MSVPTTRTSGSAEAQSLRWLLDGLVAEVPGIRSVAVVSSDGLLLLASDPALGPEHGRLGQGAALSADEEAVSGAEKESGKTESTDSVDEGDEGNEGGEARQDGGSPDEPRVPPMRRRGAAGRRRGPRGSSGDLATIVSGVASLTTAASRLTEGGAVRQTMVAMEEGALMVMAIGDGSLLGVHAAADCDMGAVGYQMGLFVGRAGHVLTPELRSELRGAMSASW
ncbi:roadblock/LC7 domain-containing protein [Streptomyces tubbatahanensis]|uniref:Roadblock/LC7 domain-containing protein n=1 Tax=Streptomyces tubbatahanensis TaxID=2923272 RepID=A0ABY3XWR4_9ACTN|nr:roadblock/LC7 domain-containing protein [Streptomyces tubbatahanensis]UNS98954.1 roadblock/LC7 domain-containing protein [Streptomyces tubbatahanensis]